MCILTNIYKQIQQANMNAQMNYTEEDWMLIEEACLNDDCNDRRCDQEIYDIINDAILDLEIGEAYELEDEHFQRVFKENYKDFESKDYYIIYDVQGDDDVALMKFKKE